MPGLLCDVMVMCGHHLGCSSKSLPTCAHPHTTLQQVQRVQQSSLHCGPPALFLMVKLCILLARKMKRAGGPLMTAELVVPASCETWLQSYSFDITCTTIQLSVHPQCKCCKEVRGQVGQSVSQAGGL